MIEETEQGLFEPAEQPRQRRHDGTHEDTARRSASIRNSRPERATPCVAACAFSPDEKVTLITDRACLGDRRRRWRASWTQLGLRYHAFDSRGPGAAPARGHARRNPGRHGDQRRQHLRGEGAGQRAAHAHADDRRREPAQDAPRAHGEHRPADHAGRHARRFRGGGPHQHAGLADGQRGAGDPRHQSGRAPTSWGAFRRT